MGDRPTGHLEEEAYAGRIIPSFSDSRQVNPESFAFITVLPQGHLHCIAFSYPFSTEESLGQKSAMYTIYVILNPSCITEPYAVNPPCPE